MSRTAIALAVFLAVSPALADPFEARPHAVIALDYRRRPTAARCPGSDVLRDQVAQRLRYDLFSAEAPERLGLTLDRVDGRYRLTGELRDQGGRVVYAPEMIEDPDCAAAVKNLAILLAVHYTTPRSPPPAVVGAPVPSAPPRSAERPPRLELGLGAFAALNRTPGPALGFAVSSTVRWPFFSIGFDWRALVPVSSEVRSSTGEIARVGSSLITSDVAPWLHLRAFFACTPIELGMRQFSGSSTIRIDTRNPFSAGFGLRGGAEWAFAQRFALRGSADLLAMWTQNVLTVQSHDFWKTPLLAGVFAVSLTASLGIGE